LPICHTPVSKVEYFEEYKLKLHFDHKCVKIVDLENMLKTAKNMFIPLKSIEYFRQVKCDGITIHWPNGVDLCPDVLYKMGKPVQQQDYRNQRARRTFRTGRKSKVKTA
jgi:hypothetical protein